jgi:hypothetical protein
VISLKYGQIPSWEKGTANMESIGRCPTLLEKQFHNRRDRLAYVQKEAEENGVEKIRGL